MIVAERKPIEEIVTILDTSKSILIAGCGECVTVCCVGGAKEVGILASQLRLWSKKAGKEIHFTEQTVQRQCEKEFVAEFKGNIEKVDAVISLACGVGVQFIAEHYPSIPVYPGVNTTFIGGTEQAGVWTEYCLSCGNCILDKTAGVCPIARCSKNLLNGPCGGSQDGKCEIDKELDCAWQLIYDRMTSRGRVEELEAIQPIKDWSTSRDGGPRKVVREDLRIN